MVRATVAVLAVSLVAPAHAWSDGFAESTRLTFDAPSLDDDRPIRGVDVSDLDAEPVSFAALATAEPFGNRGTWRINIFAGYAHEFDDDNQQAHIGMGFSYFLIEDISVDLELNLMYFDQEDAAGVGDADEWGANLNLLVRWHFFSKESWSIYVDGGAGILGTTGDVPAGGSSFNFTPQAGVGFSLSVGADARLMTGVRWHHISNANLADTNPGRDNYQVYAGLSLPF